MTANNDSPPRKAPAPLLPVPTISQAALARRQPLEYNKPDPLNPFFVVYGGEPGVGQPAP